MDQRLYDGFESPLDHTSMGPEGRADDPSIREHQGDEACFGWPGETPHCQEETRGAKGSLLGVSSCSTTDLHRER